MTQFEYIAKPPFPKSKEDVVHRVCYLEIEDLNKNIDFKNQEGIFFEVKYEPSGTEMGSVRGYIQNQQATKNPYCFIYIVAHKCPFTIKIKSDNEINLNNLRITLKPIKD